MKRIGSYGALIGCLLATNISASEEPASGIYNLQGVMELDASILLREDYTFAAEAYYGSASGYATGKWSVTDGVVHLNGNAQAKPSKRLKFTLNDVRSVTELEGAARQSDAGDWRTHYVLEMNFPGEPFAPMPGPKKLSLMFDDGKSVQVPLDPVPMGYVTYPYIAESTLKKIGVTAHGTRPTQWFTVSPSSRFFSLGWKQPAGQSMQFTKPEEGGLATAQQRTQHETHSPANTRYLFDIYYNGALAVPLISPVDIYWQFQDGSTEQTLWTDASVEQLTLPYRQGSTLKKIGMRVKGSAEAIKWFDVAADTRWVTVDWGVSPEAAQGELSGLFKDLRLEREGECLTWDIGPEKGCFRRQP